jgi:hypothetical protein
MVSSRVNVLPVTIAISCANLSCSSIPNNSMDFIFFLIATLITPPDIISQMVVGCSFILMYEILILVLFFKTFF